MNAVRLCAMASFALALLGSDADAQEVDLRAGAWDKSVALESQGNLAEARQLLVRAWGPHSDSYEVTVRLAWLSMRMGMVDDAIDFYQRARRLPGAGPEASQGLATCLTMRGFRRYEEGDWQQADESWTQALALQPGQPEATRGKRLLAQHRPLSPAVWGAYIRKSTSGPAWNGWAVFADLPWQVDRTYRLRAAYRHSSLSSSTGGGNQGRGRFASSSESSETSIRNEVYLSGAAEYKWVGAEIMGAGVWSTEETPAPAVAARLRAGKYIGGHVEVAGIRRESGWNGQVLPTVFWWPDRSFGLSVGPRITHDPDGTDVSLFGGVSLLTRPLTLSVSGHAGKERWPVTILSPSILSLAETLRYGAGGVVMVRLSDDWKVGLHGQVEALEVEGVRGTYGTAGVGLVFAPEW